MKKILICTVVLAVASLTFLQAYSEDAEAELLARAMYAMCASDYDAMLAVGTVVMNRVDSPWYPSTVTDVLSQRHQFAYGTRYDELSMRAAREVLAGRRTLDASALLYSAKDATQKAEGRYVASAGNYDFFA